MGERVATSVNLIIGDYVLKINKWNEEISHASVSFLSGGKNMISEPLANTVNVYLKEYNYFYAL